MSAEEGSSSFDVAVSYWQSKLRSEGRPDTLLFQMILFDHLVGQWQEMESRTKLIQLLGHMGPYQGSRKILSYDGTPTGKNGTDLGNWTYAVCIRHMLTLYPDTDWRVEGTDQLNDEHAGDIMEAIWGLLWHRDTKGPLMDAIPISVVTTGALEDYCKVMTSVVQLFDTVQTEYLVGSEWPSSHELARALI